MRFNPFVVVEKKIVILNVATFLLLIIGRRRTFHSKKKYLEIPDKPIKLRELFIMIDNRKCDGL